MVFLRYGIEISNTVGRTKGHINLIVSQSSDDSRGTKEDNVLENAHIKTNAVKREDFGEYVARMHALNNKGFINQYQVNHDNHTLLTHVANVVQYYSLNIVILLRFLHCHVM